MLALTVPRHHVHTYAAFLGHLPRVSIAELNALIPDLQIERMLSNSIVVFRTAEELAKADLDSWGGTILLAKEVFRGDEMALEDIPQLLGNELENAKGKLTFSLRTSGIPKPKLKDLYRTCKDYLKKKGRSSRYVGNERQAAATVLLHDAGLLNPKEGCELVILNAEDFFWVGRTVAAQDVNAYTKRDMKKPVRDTRLGLLPPKLAQVMLNMGQWMAEQSMPAPAKPAAKKKKQPLTVLDPFCGMGVIPMECLLRGWPVLASDLAQRVVDGCETNLAWLRKEFDVLKKDVPSTVWKQDARKPFRLKTPPSVVVTETHLGPALTDRPTVKDVQKIKSESEALQIDFLKNMAASLPGVPVVATWPVWFQKSGMICLERIIKELPKIGYEAVLPPGTEAEQDRTSVIYRRPDQFVGREIVCLRPIKKPA